MASKKKLLLVANRLSDELNNEDLKGGVRRRGGSVIGGSVIGGSVIGGRQSGINRLLRQSRLPMLPDLGGVKLSDFGVPNYKQWLADTQRKDNTKSKEAYRQYREEVGFPIGTRLNQNTFPRQSTDQKKDLINILTGYYTTQVVDRTNPDGFSLRYNKLFTPGMMADMIIRNIPEDVINEQLEKRLGTLRIGARDIVPKPEKKRQKKLQQEMSQ
jgi:hypothetical protein